MAKGRKHKNVEYLQTLKELSEIESKSDFARACRKHVAAVTSYLNGAEVPQRKALRSATENLMGWNVKALMEIRPLPSNLNSLPDKPGLYVLYDSAGNVLYIGKATKFRLEVRQTLKRKIPMGIRLSDKKNNLKKVRPLLHTLTHYISLYEIPSPRLRHNFEILMLRVFANQTHNSNAGKFI